MTAPLLEKHTRRLMAVLLASMVSMGMPAPAAQPRLVINIVVDGLDMDCLEALRPQMGEGGFNRLLRHGVVISNVDYGTYLDPVAATAVLMTGAAAELTGISGAETFDREHMRSTRVLSDASTLGNFTDQTYSPNALAVTTLTDELLIAGGGVTLAYSVAADPQQAIILAGHAAGAAVWLDDKTGNWASSTYYKDMPGCVTLRNRVAPLASRLDTLHWSPALPTDKYPDVPQHLRRYPFRYVFPHNDDARFDMFAASAAGNHEVTDVVGEIITTLDLGTHDGPDMVSMAYTLQPYPYTRTTDSRVEQMDAYVRLDHDLEQLFSRIDRVVGRDGALVVLAATPRSPRSRRDDERWGIPTGEFSARKAMSLLNLYLGAKYGNGEWVAAYHGGRLFLNHKLATERNINITELRADAAQLVARMAGVRHAYSLDDILAGRAGLHPEAMRRNTAPDTAGDLLLEFMPGWLVTDDFNDPGGLRTSGSEAPPMVERIVAATAPVIIMAPTLQPTTIDYTVDARSIAPTVARVLRIRSPNGASEPPLQLRHF